MTPALYFLGGATTTVVLLFFNPIIRLQGMALWMLALAFLLLAWRLSNHRRSVFVLLGVVSALLATERLAMRMQRWGEQPSWQIQAVTGQVVALGRGRFTLASESGNRLVVLPVHAEPWPFELGQQLLCRAKPRLLRRATIPGRSDPLLSALDDGVIGILQLKRLSDCRKLPETQQRPILLVRRQIEAMISGNEPGMTTPARAVLLALFLGNKRLITPELDQLYRDSGIYHLLVVSGSNLALLGGVVYGLACLLLCCNLWLLQRLNRPVLARSIALGFMMVYFLVVGNQPPVLRALLMATACIFTLIAGKYPNSVHILAVTVSAMVLTQPQVIFSVSFQLTVVATAGIIISLGWLPRQKWLGLVPNCTGQFGRIWNFVARAILQLVVCSIAAYLVTTPILAYTFNRFSPWSWLGNILFVPWFGLSVIPCGFLGMLLSPITPVGGAACIEIAVTILNWVHEGMRSFCLFTKSQWAVGAPAIPAVALWYAALLWLFGTSLHQRRRLLVGLAMLLLAALPWHRLSWHPHLKGTVLDVGDGLAVVFEVMTPPWHRQVVIADTGGPRSCQHGIVPFLERSGIKGVDAIFLSHWDNDHSGCLKQLYQTFQIDNLYMSYPGAMAGTVSRAGEKYHFGESRELTVTVLHPTSAVLQTLNSDNNRSLVLLLRYQPNIMIDPQTWLLPGDIEKAGERLLLRSIANRSLPKIDVLIAPHHGSYTSSSREFVERVAPLATIISRRRRPGRGVVERYQAVGSVIWSTARHGSLLWHSSRFSTKATLEGYTCRPNGTTRRGWGLCP